MTDYTELVKALRHVGIYQDCNECEAGRWHNEFDCCLFKDAADAIEDLQKDLTTLQKCYEIADTTVDEVLKQLPKRGKWYMELFDGDKKYQCSNCLTHWDVETRYCPYCGAKMEVQGWRYTNLYRNLPTSRLKPLSL